MGLKLYVEHVGIGLTQLLCTIIGGYPDESTSSYTYRRRIKGSKFAAVAEILIDSLFGPGHCERAYYSEINRTQVPPELR